MEINIKLSTTDIEKMLGRIYGFKDGSVKVSINGNGEIIATASEFPTQPAPSIYYGPGVRSIDHNPSCTTLSGNTSNMDLNTKVTLHEYDAPAMDHNDGCSAFDTIMERQHSQLSKTNSRASKNIMK